MTLKMLKTMQIYQKYIFWGFYCFFAIFDFLKKFIKNMGKKLGGNMYHARLTFAFQSNDT